MVNLKLPCYYNHQPCYNHHFQGTFMFCFVFFLFMYNGSSTMVFLEMTCSMVPKFQYYDIK